MSTDALDRKRDIDGPLVRVEEIKLIHDAVLRVWAIYMTWFTWFFGAQLLTLTWVVNDGVKNSTASHSLAILWMFCSILGAIGTWGVRVYSLNAFERLRELCSSDGMRDRALFVLPETPMRYAANVNLAALAAGFVVWWVVVFK